jgi:hypothetical protein
MCVIAFFVREREILGKPPIKRLFSISVVSGLRYGQVLRISSAMAQYGKTTYWDERYTK